MPERVAPIEIDGASRGTGNVHLLKEVASFHRMG